MNDLLLLLLFSCNIPAATTVVAHIVEFNLVISNRNVPERAYTNKFNIMIWRRIQFD